MSESSTSATRAAAYHAAHRRAEELVVAAHPAHSSGRWSWEGTAMRDLLAFAFYATALRDRADVREVPLGRVLIPLNHQEPFELLVHAALTAVGHRLDSADPADPVSMRWAWLQRRWDPNAPTGQRWDGLSRGIGRGLSDPAIVVCLPWAEAAVDRALAAERGALARRTRVEVTGGDFAGDAGFVESPAWRITADGRSVEPGPPGGYMVRLDRPDTVGPVERILADELEPASGRVQ